MKFVLETWRDQEFTQYEELEALSLEDAQQHVEQQAKLVGQWERVGLPLSPCWERVGEDGTVYWLTLAEQWMTLIKQLEQRG